MKSTMAYIMYNEKINVQIAFSLSANDFLQ